MKHLSRTTLLACLLLLGSCGSEGDARKSDRPVIGVSVLTLSNPFFGYIADAIKKEAEARGFDVIVTSGELDIGRQKNQISDFVVQDVAAIIITPVDSKSIGTSIAEANRAGIPVFTADIATTAEGVKVVAHIATDNYQAGQMAAKALIEATGGMGKVGIIDHPEVESVIMRTRGFMDEIAANARGMRVVSRLPGSGARDRAFKAAEDMLQAHPDLVGIFAINDPSALGAVAAIEKAGRSGQISVVGIDGNPEGLEAVRNGKMYADAVQHPDEIGRRTVEAIDRYMGGEALPPQVLIPTDLYRKQDAARVKRP